jgi:hypothetical protein
MVRRFKDETSYSEDVKFVALGSGDADLVVDGMNKEVKKVLSHRRIPYAVRVAHEVKAEVGLLSDTKANKLVLQRLCREKMLQHKVRPSHIAHSLPLAVAACLIPLDSDWLASCLLRSKQHKDRLKLLGETPVGK